MPRSYPPEFRRKVLDLVASGRKVAEVAQLLGVSDRTIYVWRANTSSTPDSCPERTAATCPNWLRPASVSPSWRPSWPSTGELPNCWVR